MRNDTRRGAVDAGGEVAGGGVGVGADAADPPEAPEGGADGPFLVGTALRGQPPLLGGAALSMHRSMRSLRL